MAQDDPVRRSSDALGAYFVGDLSMGDALTKMCEAALDEVGPAVMAGVSMTVDARVGTYVFSHPEVQQVDQPQYDTGDGPCVEAFNTGEVVQIDSTRGPGPYPRFRRVAAEHGLLSVLSVPMDTGDHVVGALNLYAREEAAFDAAEIEAARSFARQAAFLLLNHQAYWDAHSLSENLMQALASRATIEQAKGIIMATTRCTPEEAFEQLRAQSQHENVKLREIAEEIVRAQGRRG